MVDPVRESRSLPPPAPVSRIGGGRAGDSAPPEARTGGEGAAAGRGGGGEATPARRVALPERAAEGLARAAAALAVAGDPLAEARLEALALDPRLGAGGLRDAAGRGAVPLRVALLAAAAEVRGGQRLADALDAFVQRLTAALPPTGVEGQAVQAAALDGVQEALGRLAPLALPAGNPGEGVGRGLLDALAGRLLRELGLALAERGGAGRDGLAGALSRADLGALAARLGGPVLALVLALPPESELRRTLIARALGAVHSGSRDPRLALLGQLAEDTTAPVERTLASLVGALEGEAASNAVRRESGEPTVWTVPLHDGQSWTTLTLLEDRHGRDARDARERDGGGTRVAVGTEFSALGPVRADLAVSRERIVLRFVASEPSTAVALRQHLGELRERLTAHAREVHVNVAEGRPEDARVELPPPVMDHLDLSG